MIPGLDALGFVSLRLIALFSVAPFFSHKAVPVRVRLALAFAVALAITPQLPVAPVLAQDHVLGLAGAAAGEVWAGLVLGFTVRLVFAALDVLAEAVSIQGGLGAAQVIDPASGHHAAALGAVLGVVGLAVWMAIGGHHELLRAVWSSYELMPLGGGGPSPDSLLAVVGLGGAIFTLGMQLAAPVTVAMMVANVASGILGRAIPQLNLITLQLPAHVAGTLLILTLGAHELVSVFGGELESWTGRALEVVAGVR